MLPIGLLLLAGSRALSADPAHDEKAAIAEITTLGGTVNLDEETPGRPVVAVTLDGKQVTDAVLERLKGRVEPRRLSLLNTQVTDGGLTHLRGSANLQELNIISSQLTDAGLGHLRNLTSLEALYLSTTQVTDTGVEHLAELAKLQRLKLDMQLTDTGM